MTQALQLYPTSTQTLPFDQEEVTTILLMVEHIKPEEIVHPEQLLHVGPYSFAQVRLAIAQQALLCVGNDEKAVKRIGQDRTARLYVYYPTNGNRAIPRSVEMSIGDSQKFILEYTCPILEPSPDMAVWIRYADFRQLPHRFTFLSQLQRNGATLEDMRRMWAGLRFLCRNLREWERDGITWPEEV